MNKGCFNQDKDYSTKIVFKKTQDSTNGITRTDTFNDNLLIEGNHKKQVINEFSKSQPNKIGKIKIKYLKNTEIMIWRTF